MKNYKPKSCTHIANHNFRQHGLMVAYALFGVSEGYVPVPDVLSHSLLASQVITP